jgi:hypothetical protein
MNRTVTLAGFLVLVAALVTREFVAQRAKRHDRPTRLLGFGDFVIAAARLTHVRLVLLAGWLWLGWHLFARVSRR